MASISLSTLNNEAVELMVKGNYEDAIDCFRDAVGRYRRNDTGCEGETQQHVPTPLDPEEKNERLLMRAKVPICGESLSPHNHFFLYNRAFLLPISDICDTFADGDPLQHGLIFSHHGFESFTQEWYQMNS
jgi:hypothetical protein